jgi:hypothetical protein
LDNFNTIVNKIRNKPTLIRNNSASATNNAAATMALPAGLSGAFSGQFVGSEQGTFTVVVGPNGQLTGIGQSASSGNLTVGGVVTPNGMIVMGAATQDKKLNAQFQGFINPTSGELLGTWRTDNGSSQGTFNGKRQ